jgi:hypothetical protein
VICVIDRRFTPDLQEALETYLGELFSKAETCPDCGGILPELILDCDGKQYYFTCYEIENVYGMTIRTDEKFAEYYRKMHLKEER